MSVCQPLHRLRGAQELVGHHTQSAGVQVVPRGQCDAPVAHAGSQTITWLPVVLSISAFHEGRRTTLFSADP